MINESNRETIEILSEMRSEYNCFGDPEEVARYHALSEAIKAVAESIEEKHYNKTDS